MRNKTEHKQRSSQMQTRSIRTLKEIAVDIRSQLKKQYPQCKFSIRTEYYSMGQALHISLMSGNFEAFTSDEKHYVQLNQYQFSNKYAERINNGTVLTDKAWEVMKFAYELTLKDNWDNSDSMTDYFDVNFYLHLNIGNWDKPYTVKK